MSGGTPYIGSTISLISKAEIRYEGILWSIDTKDSTVTLANVRSYGTEHRAAEKKVGPRSEVYEYIVFRGSDIKDLHVSKAPKPVNAVNQDPSILQQGAVGAGFSHFSSTAPFAAGYSNFSHPYGYGTQPAAYSPVPQPGINPGRTVSPMGVQLIQSRTPSPPVNVAPIGSQTKTLESETQTPQPPSQKATQTGRPRRRSGSRRNSSEGNQNGPNKPVEKRQENEEAVKNQKPDETKPKGPAGGQKSGGQQQSGNTKKGKSIKFNGEFDFESSNARFDKERIESELKSEIEKMKISSQDEEVIVENEVEADSPVNDGVYYDKSKSFYDFISSDPLPSDQGRRAGNWQAERKLNVETFGVTGSYTRGYGRGRGWRGRGRGRGWGRGRGGYRGGNNDRDGGNEQENRTNYRGGRGGFRGNRGLRGTWRNSSSNDNRNRSANGERVKSEPSETSS